MLLDEAGAQLGTSPLKVLRPTAQHPLRVRATRDGRSSALMRVLPAPHAKELTVDLSDWAHQQAAAAQPATTEGPTAVGDEASVPAKRPKAQRPRRTRRNSKRRRQATPETEVAATERPAAVVSDAVSEPPSEAAAAPEPPSETPVPAEPTRPRIGVIEDSKPKIDLVDDTGPSVGLVDEAQTPNVGIIEE